MSYYIAAAITFIGVAVAAYFIARPPKLGQKPASNKKQKKKKSEKAIPGGLTNPEDEPKAVDLDALAASIEGEKKKKKKRKDKSRVPETTDDDVVSPNVLDTSLDTSDTKPPKPIPQSKSSDEDSPKKHSLTLAEKLLPKPPHTGVEDMLEVPDVPAPARVMRVAASNYESFTSGISGSDWAEGTEEDDDGWDIVPSKAPRRDKSGTPTAAPTPQSSSQVQLTKQQRQNAAKRDAKKAAKAEAEADRLERLAKHKKELERLRIEEQYKQSKKNNKLSGGMTSQVIDGRLVWD